MNLAELIQGHAAVQVTGYHEGIPILSGNYDEILNFANTSRQVALNIASQVATIGGLLAAVDHDIKGIDSTVIDGAGFLVQDLGDTLCTLIDMSHTASLGLKTAKRESIEEGVSP